ncbi:glutathione peroxidase [uncultured Chitinophaga sp.]|jgi:Glutathione peroxidase|uniref:glutathione peroxidase n=1 Tax=uncultured Chitinophaga sp. TaxID=339340 RepID=UPI002622DD7B|nr:glutathione peroxidase [uncultured Chitinophaga sp.]
MTGRQSFLQKFYPLIMRFARTLGKKGRILQNRQEQKPRVAFSTLTMVSNKGDMIPMSQFSGRHLLLVNTASDCGYTAQYAELQELHERFPQLVIIGFPANDFKEQEKGDDADIARFCQLNFGVTFTLAAKSSVLKGPQQNNIFRWLTDPGLNGWNHQQPEWNFSKYLVNSDGMLTHYFGPAVSPLGKEVLGAVGVISR